MGIIDKKGALIMATGIDNTGLIRGAEQAKQIVKGIADDTIKSSAQMETSIKGIGSALAALGGTAAIGALGKQILDTTAKFEKFGIVLKNTLGEAEGAAALDMIAQFAATTPFQLDEVTAAFIKMANQGFVPTKSELVKLGDLASSTGKSFDQLTEALLDAQTGQFERLKEFGIKASANGDKVTFSFKEQQTTVNNTNSAIQDYMLSLGDLQGVQGANAKISESLTGQLSNLQDKLEAMYNTIGTSNSGILYAAVGGVSNLIDNYETIGKVLIGLVAVYGSYKAGVLIAAAANSIAASSAAGYTVAQTLQYQTLLLTEKAQALLNKTMLSNPYVAATMLVLGLVGAMTLYANSAKEVRTEKELLNDIDSEAQKNTKQQVSNLELLKQILNDSNKSYGERKIALEKLKEIVPDYNASLTREGELINNNSDALNTYVQKLVIAEKIKAAAVKQSTADEAFNSFKEENKDVLTNALRKKINGDGLFAGEAAALETWKKLAAEAQNYGNVINKLQSELISIDAKSSDKATSETPAQKKARLAAEKKARLAQEKLDAREASGEYDAKKDLQSLLIDLQNQTANLLIKNSEDNLKNRLAQIELEKQAELQKITDKEVSIVEAYNKAHKGDKNYKELSTKPGDIQNSINTIDPALGKQLQTATTGVVSAYGEKAKEETKKWNDEILSLAREFADKRVQIAYDYNEKIKKLQSEGLIDAANLARKERDKAVSDETASMIQNTDLFKTITDEKLNISKKATEQLLENIREQLLNEFNAGKLSVEKMNELMDQVNNAQDKVSSNKNQNNPFAQLGSAISGNKKAKADYQAALADPTKTKEQLAGLESAANNATQAMAGAAGAALQGAQGILQSVVGGLDQLGLLTEEQKKDADNVIGMVGGAANIAMGIATGNPMAIIQGSVDLLVNAFEYFDYKSKDIAKKQKALVKEVDNLKDAYDRLERAVSKAFSTDAVKLQVQEIANLRDQIKANNEWIEQEEQKKKKKQDQDAIDSRKKENENLKNQIEDTEDSIVESMTGTSMKSAIDNFAQAYVDAWSSGEDAAKKSADVVKNIFKSAISEALKKNISADVEKLNTMISDAFYDGIITAKEKADIYAQQQLIDSKAERDKKLADDLGLKDDSSTKSGVTGELQAAMTEGTGSQLVGLWNMTAMDIRWIREFLAARSQSSSPVITGDMDMVKVMNALYVETYQIQLNTKVSAENSTKLVEKIGEVKTELTAAKTELTEIKKNTGSSSRGSRA